MNEFNIIKIFNKNENAINYLIVQNILKQKKCWKCKSQMNIYLKKEIFRCSNAKCRYSYYLYKNTFFLIQNYRLITFYGFVICISTKMPIGGIEQTSGVASEAITAWTKYLSQLSAYSVNFEEVKIRGVGIVVEVDETKLGKRKYNRGHLVERVWVIVGVERTSLKKLFCIEVKDRTKETIENVLKTFVEPGSIIYTDGWKPYFNACNNFNLAHFTVNHKFFF